MPGSAQAKYRALRAVCLRYVSHIKYKVWTRLNLVACEGSLRITGLVVDDGNVLYLNRDAHEAFVNDNWDDNRWHNNSVVVFRDCSK